jgi:hypothetical protein
MAQTGSSSTFAGRKVGKAVKSAVKSAVKKVTEKVNFSDRTKEQYNVNVEMTSDEYREHRNADRADRKEEREFLAPLIVNTLIGFGSGLVTLFTKVMDVEQAATSKLYETIEKVAEKSPQVAEKYIGFLEKAADISGRTERQADKLFAKLIGDGGLTLLGSKLIDMSTKMMENSESSIEKKLDELDKKVTLSQRDSQSTKDKVDAMVEKIKGSAH